jgi:putative ABC transport system permease protein
LPSLLLWKFYIRELRVRRKRIALTVLAIVWGTLSIVLLLAFGEGIKRQLGVAQRGLGEDIVVMWGGQTSMPYKGLGKGRRILFRREDIMLLKERIPDIRCISGEYGRWGVNIKYGNESVSRHCIGVEPCYGEIRNYNAEALGRFINKNDMENKRRVIFLGTQVKEELFGNRDPVGETVSVDGAPFVVIGWMKDKLQMGMYSGPDENKVAVPSTVFETIYGHRYLNTVVWQARDADRIDAVEREIARVLSAKHGFHPDDPTAISTWNVAEMHEEFDNMMFGIQIFLGIIGTLTLIVAGVGVANIMYVTVREGTRDIGVKMALGARTAQIMHQFIIEALLIAFLGGTIGIACAGTVVSIIRMIPVDSEAIQWVGKPIISWQIAILSAVILGVIGFVAGVFPSRKAAAVSPVESLRYE